MSGRLSRADGGSYPPGDGDGGAAGAGADAGSPDAGSPSADGGPLDGGVGGPTLSCAEIFEDAGVGAAPTFDAGPAFVIAGGAGQAQFQAISALTLVDDRLYVLDGRAARVSVLALDGGLLQGFDVSQTALAKDPSNAGFSIAADPDGGIYLSGYPDPTVYAFTSSGQARWTASSGFGTGSMFGFVGPSGFRLAIPDTASPDGGSCPRGCPGEYALLDEAGTAAGILGLEAQGGFFTQAPNGNLVQAVGGYVYAYDTTGKLLTRFGSPGLPGAPPFPFAFYYEGGAVELADGSFDVADGQRGIEHASAQGFYQSTAPDQALGRLTPGSSLFQSTDGDLFFTSGGYYDGVNQISRISSADLTALLAAPASSSLGALGYGASVTVPAKAHYFPAGQPPSVTLAFDPWWQTLAPDLTVQVGICERKQVLAGAMVPLETVAIPATGDPTALRLSSPPAATGFYEVRAQLSYRGQPVGSQTEYYSVGAPADGLDFATLPAGEDCGGAAPARDVALLGELGFSDARAGIDWSRLLPAGSTSLDFAAYDSAFAAAAQLAAQNGVAFHVQVGQGGPETALVRNGSWGSYVQQLVAHYKGTIHTWECWNEPNDNTFSSAADYVTNALIPFYEAVKAADPSAQVIGGSAVGMDIGYWSAIAAAGGLSHLDIVGIHPYPGHNRAFEEQGFGLAF
ncbi:MAG: NHL repeat-containing protein, partial [Deltaproteobacteria bacterium]